MKLRSLVAALLALSFAVPALADGPNVYPINGDYKNAVNGARVDASGNARTSEALKDRDYTLSGDLINNSLGNQSADSSAVLPIGDIRRLSFFIRPTLVGGKRVRLAIQIRLHKTQAADSTSMYVWQPDMCFSQNYRNVAANADSIGDTGTFPSAYEAAMPGEFIVAWDPARGSPTAALFGAYPNAKCLNIECLGGARWFSIRVRNCSANVTVPVVISYTGSPL